MCLTTLGSLILLLAVSGPQDADPAQPANIPPGLLEKLIDSINNGSIPGRSEASRTGFLEGGKKISWGDLDAGGLFKLLDASGFEGDDLLALADWAWSAGLKQEAGSTLARYVEADRKARQAAANRTVARWRGCPVPEGGYTYHPQYGWENLRERSGRQARARAAALCGILSTTDDAAALERAAADLAGQINTPGLPAGARAAIQADGLAALKTARDRRLRSIEERAEGASGEGLLRKLQEELHRRREAALKVILDATAYTSKKDAVNGQEKVDRLVLKEYAGSLGELWASPGAVLMALDPAMQADAETVRRIHKDFMPRLGMKLDADDLKSLDRTLDRLGRKIDPRKPGPDEKEEELYRYNRRVDTYNDALDDADIPAEAKAHARIINDYREMMGFRRLFLDARLCRAARKHSAACNEAGRIWHEGPDGDPQMRARREGFPDKVAENVGIQFSSPAEIWWKGWFRSSDHHRIALAEKWTCMGYGYAGIVGTQTFSRTALPRNFPP